MLRARVAAVAAVMVVALATGGCSSGGSAANDDGAAHGVGPVAADAPVLLRELAQVRATDEARAWTAYGDLAAQRALGGGTVPKELSTLSGYGWPTTMARDAQARSRLGLDGAGADRVLEVGESHGAGRFDGGISPDTVVEHAKRLGAERDGTAGSLTLWRLAPDDQLQPRKAVGEISRGTADFNVLATGGDTVVRAPSREAAELLSAGNKGHTLGSDADYRALAACLGTPLAATFTDQRVGSGGASARPAAFTTAAGVSGGDVGRLTQVACRTAGSADEAREVAAALRDEVAHGRTRLSRLPWSGLLSHARVEVTRDHVVRLTGTSLKSPQVILEMLRSGDLTDLLATGD